MSKTWRAGLTAAAVLSLTACTQQLDMGKVKTLISDMIAQQVGATVKSVTCPAERTVTAGDVFECTAEIDHGQVPVAVTQKDGQGNIAAELKVSILKIGELEKIIAGNIKQNSGVDAEVACGPRFRPSTPDEKFDCTATVGSEEVKVVVTVSDAKGNVSFSSAPSEPEPAQE